MVLKLRPGQKQTVKVIVISTKSLAHVLCGFPGRMVRAAVLVTLTKGVAHGLYAISDRHQTARACPLKPGGGGGGGRGGGAAAAARTFNRQR